MRYKTAFRLALRVLGVLIIAQSLPWLLTSCGFLALELVLGFSASSTWDLRSGMGQLLGTAAGLYLFFGGRWIVDRAIPSNRPYCHECGYELTGLPAEGACPECGTAFRQEAPRPKPAQ